MKVITRFGKGLPLHCKFWLYCRFILNTIWYKNNNDVETLPVKRTVKDAIELLRNCDLGQMVRYAATIWQTKFGALFRFAFLRASQLQFIFQQCLNKPLWTRLAESKHLVQITFHCIYIDKWYLSVEHKVFTHSSFCRSWFI